MTGENDHRIADYVLGLMEADEAARFEQMMEADAELAYEVAASIAAFHAIDETAVPQAPDDALWRRIEQRLAGPAAMPTRSRRSARAALWDSLRFWRWSGIGGLTASTALAAALVVLALRPLPAPRLVAILESEDGSPAGAIVEVSEEGRARLIPLQDIPVPAGRALEVWTKPDPQGGPVSVALIDRARQAELATAALPPAHPTQLFEITLEPETGSPIGRPTGPILFKGLAVQTF